MRMVRKVSLAMIPAWLVVAAAILFTSDSTASNVVGLAAVIHTAAGFIAWGFDPPDDVSPEGPAGSPG